MKFKTVYVKLTNVAKPPPLHPTPPPGKHNIINS